MSAPVAEKKIYKGLAGVIVDTTAISKVVPETNSLTYRGYPVQDLAAHCSFEQVAYLLWHGELPSDGELALFNQRERASRRIDRSLQSLLAKLPDWRVYAWTLFTSVFTFYFGYWFFDRYRNVIVDVI